MNIPWDDFMRYIESFKDREWTVKSYGGVLVDDQLVLRVVLEQKKGGAK